MVSRADAQRLRNSQIGVAVLVGRDLDRMWQKVWSSTASGPTQAANARDAYLRLVPDLVAQYGEMASAVAADWYEAQRQAAGIGGAFTVALQASPYVDAVEGTVRRTAGALWTDTPEAMLTGLRPAVGKYVLAAGRATITRAADKDPRAYGWSRVGSGGSCRFCLMLIGRGAVYRESSVHFASHKGCDCCAVPSWDANAPEVEVDVYQASQRTSGMSQMQKDKHNARIREALDRLVPQD